MESIQFPALGWSFSVDPVLVDFTLFGIPFSIRWYGLLIAIGFLLAVIYAVKNGKSVEKKRRMCYINCYGIMKGGIV